MCFTRPRLLRITACEIQATPIAFAISLQAFQVSMQGLAQSHTLPGHLQAASLTISQGIEQVASILVGIKYLR